MTFKSYGNTAGGRGWVAKIGVSTLQGSSAPTVGDFEWQRTFPTDYMSAKAAVVGNGRV